MKIQRSDDTDKFRSLGSTSPLFSMQGNINSVTITPKDFGSILTNLSDKQKLFVAIFKILEEGKEVKVNFGNPTAQTNYFAVELAASDTVDYFRSKYGITIEIKKDSDDNLASGIIFNKVCTDDVYEDNPPEDEALAPVSFFEENYLGTCDGADFGRDNITVRAGDYTWIAILHSPFMQVVQYKKILNIPQDNTPNSTQYDPNGLFIYFNEERNEIEIILNREENIEDEYLHKTAIIPLIVYSLKNNFPVSLNFGSTDLGELNYKTHTAKLFEHIDHAYRAEACSNLSVRVEEREEAENIFAFVILTPE